MTQEIIAEGKKGCPECKSLDFEEVVESHGVFFGLLDLFLGDHKREFKCSRCGCVWKE